MLPPAGELGDPPLSEAEGQVRRGRIALAPPPWPPHDRPVDRSRRHLGGLNDSPAGLAAYLVEKYRRWSDCDGDVERRFSKDQLCDYLTMYWATETIASSMRLYWGERSDRWRPAPGETVDVPAACGIFPAEIINPPREWTARLLAGLRSWTEMPRGGHFAAHEEPELLADDALSS